MQSKTDAQLLRDYAELGVEAAFTELVQRHTNLIYSAAFRQVESADVAAELTQNVFVSLARDAKAHAPRFSPEASLAGWLCRAARNLSLNHRRDEFRRQTREQQAMEQLLPISEDAPDWGKLRRVLDDAMAELNESDYDAIVLRFFQNQDFRAVGAAIGVSDDTAQKRVARALDKLRDLLAQRGIRTTAGALGIALTANAVQAAPLGLAATISGAALAGATTTTSTLVAATTKTIAMTLLQKTIITAAFVAAAGAGIYQARQAAHLRDQVQTLQQSQTALNHQLATAMAENARLTNRLAQVKEDKGLSQAQFAELLKLRGQKGQNQTALSELEKMQAASRQTRAMSTVFTNAMQRGMEYAEKWQQKRAQEKLLRMIEQLHLTDGQAQSVSNILMRQIEENTQRSLAAVSGQPVVTSQGEPSEDSQIQALLTPDQLAAYPEFEQSEKEVLARNTANSQVALMQSSMDLTPDQQSQLKSALYQYELNQSSSLTNQMDMMTKARANGDIADATTLAMEIQKQQLADKLKLFTGILTPDQLKSYQKSQTDMMEMQMSALKMFLPQTNDVSNP